MSTLDQPSVYGSLRLTMAGLAVRPTSEVSGSYKPETVTSTRTEKEPRDRSEAAERWCLVVLHSPDHSIIGRRMAIEPRVCFGRAAGEGIDAVVEDTLISRRHATIRRRKGVSIYEVEDHDSKNGTYVDGARIQRTTVSDGTVVRVGGTLMVLEAHDPALLSVADDSDLVGRSTSLRRLLLGLDRAAPTDLSVLLLGETGTGKELVARRIHRLSGAEGPLVTVNCSAIPRELMESYFFGHRKGAFTGATDDAAGLFRSASGGTLFLDEVGELPLALQPKLLRALENHEVTPVGGSAPHRVEVRVVAATNSDLSEAVAAGQFRRDLYARLAGYVAHLPPLRSRRSDIPLLFRHFLEEAAPNRSFGVTSALIEDLLLHPWPMNVRELRSLSRRLALLEDTTTLGRSHLPEAYKRKDGTVAVAAAGPGPAGAPSRQDLVDLLEQHNGSVARLADHFGKDRRQIYRWLKKHEISPDDYRSE